MQANDAADDANPESRGGDLNARVRGAGGRASPFYASTARLTYIEGREGRKEGPVPGRSVNGRARVQSFALAPRVGRRRKREGGREEAITTKLHLCAPTPTWSTYRSRIAALWVCMRRLLGRFVRPRCPLGECGKNEEGRRAIATVAGADAGGYGAGAVAGEGMPWIGEAATVP